MVNSKVRFNIIAEGNFNMEVQQHMVNISSENPKVVPKSKIHPVVKKLFTEEILNVPLAGRLPQFMKQWEKIMCNQ